MSTIISSKSDLEEFQKKLKEKFEKEKIEKLEKEKFEKEKIEKEIKDIKPKCYIETNVDGETLLEWKVNGVLHRHPDGLPSIIQYHKNGERKYEQWSVNGKCHRSFSEGAAVQYYDASGNIEQRFWYSKGKEMFTEKYSKDGKVLEIISN